MPTRLLRYELGGSCLLGAITITLLAKPSLWSMAPVSGASPVGRIPLTSWIPWYAWGRIPSGKLTVCELENHYL